MVDTTPYSPPPDAGRWRAITLAIAVHAGLIAFLWIGVSWQSETPIAVEAEIWDMQAKEAAPKQVAPPPQARVPEPEPKRKPEPKPEPKPETKAEIMAPAIKPEIALEQERKRQKKIKREEAENRERLAKIKAEDRAEKDKLAEREKQAADLKAKQAADLQAKKEASKKRDDAQLEKLLAQTRAQEMQRITGTSGTVAGSGGTGTAVKSQGMRGDPSYAAKIAAKIKSNTSFAIPADLVGNPSVEYDVQLFPDGSLRGAPRKVKSSGIPAFDDAVRRAIELAAPFPADKSGSVPAGFPVIHRPKEQ